MIRWISPPVAYAVAAVAMWWVGRTFAVGSYSFAHQAAIGVVLIVLGAVIVAMSLRSFAVMGTTLNPTQPQKASELVTSGVYSLSRNPMHVGDAVILAGTAVWIGNIISLVPLERP